MDYLIGDLQGCRDALAQLLDETGFSPSRDQLYVLGDLINRGPDSAGTLALLASLGGSAKCLLGNHDLSYLAVAHGHRKPGKRDTTQALLVTPLREQAVEWLRGQKLARFEQGWLMVHAGVLPGWTVADTLDRASEIERQLQGPDLPGFLAQMFGNQPAQWSDQLDGPDRHRVIVNALTRMRYCTPQGQMEFDSNEGLDSTPDGHLPWFRVPGRLTAEVPVAFGHWSTLGLVNEPRLLALDTGCVWGGHLSAARLGPEGQREIIQVKCPQAQDPLA